MASKYGHRQLRDSERVQKVLALRRQGLCCTAIAVELGVTRQAVHKLVKSRIQKAVAAAEQDADFLRQAELERLDYVEMESIKAWQKSREDAVKITNEMTVTADGGKDAEKTREEREGQAGDPRFLAIIQKCVEQRAKLLGINKEQAESSGASSGGGNLLINVGQLSLGKLSDSDLSKYIAEAEQEDSLRREGPAAGVVIEVPAPVDAPLSDGAATSIPPAE